MPNFESIVFAIIQAAILLLIAPVFTGISRVMRAKMHSRKGPGILQDYRDLIKLMKRQDVASGASGMMFRIMPYELLGSVLLIAMVIPVFSLASPLGMAGDLITIAYLFSNSRTFPGHGIWTRRATVSEGILSICRFMRCACFLVKNFTSKGMSSGRARSGGMTMGKTLSR